MSLPIALQLYTLREALADDFQGVMTRVAEIGYAGVEPAGFHGVTVTQASALFRALGLAVPSAHLPMPEGEERPFVAEVIERLEVPRIVSGGIGPQQFETLDGVKQACERFNRAQEFARAHGATFGIHNHWWEFEPVEGRLPYQIMLAELDPTIFWEIDVYWVQSAGLDPAEVLRELGARAPLLHIKDGPAVKGEPQVAVGEGTVAFHPIIEAGQPHTEWLIVELDHCATDMLEAVRLSFEYLKEEGWGHGAKG